MAWLKAAVLIPAGLLVLASFHSILPPFQDHRLVPGRGFADIPWPEMVFSVWYFTLGIVGASLMAAGLASIPWLSRPIRFSRLLENRRFQILLVVLVFLAARGVRHVVLRDQPVTDDEMAYEFIAKTLLKGRFVNPLPGDDRLFQNQFIFVNDRGWFGMYPIGHPFFLACGMSLGLLGWVVPLESCLSLLFVLLIGRRVYSPAVASLAGVLLLVSPQFLFTGATRLSQPSESLCMLAGTWALLVLADTGRTRYAAIAGLAFGMAVLVRPMPGCLFTVVAFAHVVASSWRSGAWPLFTRLAVTSVPVVACGLVLCAVNWVQSGHPLKTGYHMALHDNLGTLAAQPATARTAALITQSVFGGMLRQNFWFLGWPLSFVFLPWARRNAGAALLWAMVGADYAYRILVPKTAVSSTGPVYLAEIVPLLALLTASGIVELRSFLRRHQFGNEGTVPAIVLGSMAAAMVIFLPVQVEELRRSGRLRGTCEQMLKDAKAGRALVFANEMTDQDRYWSWAFYPPSPSPDLDDDVIYVRIPDGEDGAGRAVEFWKRRFADRSAWVYRVQEDRATLTPLGQGAPAAGEAVPTSEVSLSGAASTEVQE